MAEAPTPQELQALDELTGAVAAHLARGEPREQVVAQVVATGWDRPTAQTLVDEIAQALDVCRSSPGGLDAARPHTRRLLVGLALGAAGAGGVLATSVLGSVATAVGGTAVVAGTVLVVWGLLGRLSVER